MSIIEQPEPAELSESLKDFAEAETTPNAEVLTPENFQFQAEDILATLGEAAKKDESKQDAFRRATESYVGNAESLAMRQHAEVILAAPMAVAAQRRIRSLQAVYQDQKTPALKEIIDNLRTSLCTYNHLVRDLVWQNPGMFSREQLVNWVSKSSGAEAWSRQMVSGVAGEVAAAQALAKVPGVQIVEFGTVQDDLHGVDLRVTSLNSNVHDIDLKYGESQPRLGSDHRGNVIILGIEPDMIQGFSIRTDRQQEFADNYYAAL